MDGIALTIWILVQLAFDSRPSMNEGLRQSQDDIGFMQIGNPVPTESQFWMPMVRFIPDWTYPFYPNLPQRLRGAMFCTDASKPRSGHECIGFRVQLFMGFLRIALEFDASTISCPLQV